MKKKNIKLDYCPSCGTRMVLGSVNNIIQCYKCDRSSRLEQLKRKERIRELREKKLKRILK